MKNNKIIIKVFRSLVYGIFGWIIGVLINILLSLLLVITIAVFVPNIEVDSGFKMFNLLGKVFIPISILIGIVIGWKDG